MTRIMTIDGPAGVGKSTIARLVAQKLNIPFLNTGAMFRAIAHKLGEAGLALSEEALEKKCSDFNFRLGGAGSETILFCNEQPVGEETRTEKIALLASKFSQRPAIRNFLLNAQREMGKHSDLVTEGRDMGTVVFPSASCKFFLDATPEIRAQRRMKDFQSMGSPVPSLEDLQKKIKARDEQDKSRALAPLKAATDAQIIDTSNLTIEQALDTILAKLRACGVNG